jgi:hypothetical protein
MSADAPSWLSDVSGWLVSYAEARFGLCRMLLWFGDELASVATPDPEYLHVERALDELTLTELWRHGLLPTDRPGLNAVAPLLRPRRTRYPM